MSRPAATARRSNAIPTATPAARSPIHRRVEPASPSRRVTEKDEGSALVLFFSSQSKRAQGPPGSNLQSLRPHFLALEHDVADDEEQNRSGYQADDLRPHDQHALQQRNRRIGDGAPFDQRQSHGGEH